MKSKLPPAVLYAMTVYGFLNYHDETLTIPNKELRMKFEIMLLKITKWENFQTGFEVQSNA